MQVKLCGAEQQLRSLSPRGIRFGSTGHPISIQGTKTTPKFVPHMLRRRPSIQEAKFALRVREQRSRSLVRRIMRCLARRNNAGLPRCPSPPPAGGPRPRPCCRSAVPPWSHTYINRTTQLAITCHEEEARFHCSSSKRQISCPKLWQCSPIFNEASECGDSFIIFQDTNWGPDEDRALAVRSSSTAAVPGSNRCMLHRRVFEVFDRLSAGRMNITATRRESGPSILLRFRLSASVR